MRALPGDLGTQSIYYTPLCSQDPSVELIECHYPLIDRWRTTPYHCLHGYIEFLNDRLGLNIRPRWH